MEFLENGNNNQRNQWRPGCAIIGIKIKRNPFETEMNFGTTWERYYGESCQSSNRIYGMGRGRYRSSQGTQNQYKHIKIKRVSRVIPGHSQEDDKKSSYTILQQVNSAQRKIYYKIAYKEKL